MAIKTVGKNVKFEVSKEGKLTITVDLKEENGMSKSGKTLTIATSNGNTKALDHAGNEFVFGVNVYKYPDKE